jgi:hypothetical protein
VVDSFECVKMHGLTNPKRKLFFENVTSFHLFIVGSKVIAENDNTQ